MSAEIHQFPVAPVEPAGPFGGGPESLGPNAATLNDLGNMVYRTVLADSGDEDQARLFGGLSRLGGVIAAPEDLSQIQSHVEQVAATGIQSIDAKMEAQAQAAQAFHNRPILEVPRTDKDAEDEEERLAA